MGSMFNEPPTITEAIDTIAFYLQRKDFSDKRTYEQLKPIFTGWINLLNDHDESLNQQPSPNQLNLL